MIAKYLFVFLNFRYGSPSAPHASRVECGFSAMLFVFSDPSAEIQGNEYWGDPGLIRIKINQSLLALVAFRTRELGRDYFNPEGLETTCGLIDDVDLAEGIRETLIGEPVLEFQDEFMMAEIRRLGGGFPFCEFVTEYGMELGSEI